jgi:3-(3-hydroxy-phenyl)propionate hydroxylase
VSATDDATTDVLVAGFGPTGALAASLLGQRGIRTLAIDRSRDVYDKPRAIAIDHEILRLFDNIGLAEKIAPHIAPFPASEHFGAEGQLIRRIDMVPPPYPLGYTPTMVFSQPPVEAALRAHAASYPNVTVELGTELFDVEQNDLGVNAHLRTDNGQTRSVTVDYLIACDGAASPVRERLGIALDDLEFDEPWLVVDILVHDRALEKLPRNAAQYCDPARPTSYIVGPGNHRRWEIMLLPGEDPRAMENPAEIWRLLARWLTPDDATLWRAASYRFHALVAREWRRGRIFLAGDAAHQQPPFIGQGMCQGLRDAANLVWKLDRVLKGQSSEALLDSYAEERAAHVRELTTRIKAIGRVICERDPAAARARDARILAEGGGAPRTITRQEIVPPLQSGLIARNHAAAGTLFPQPWVRSHEKSGLLDAVSGTGWRLALDGRHAIALSPAMLHQLTSLAFNICAIAPDGGTPSAVNPQVQPIIERDGVMAAWFDRHACRAAIVRPDHYVYGVATNETELVALLETLKQDLA